jgi:predicted ATP-grasp superfamily ATP-dependent carboligase
LNALDYVGPAGIDFKFDARDQTYKVIEINWRFGLSDGLAGACGLDIPYIYYRDVQGLPVTWEGRYSDHVFWCWLEKEIEWFRSYSGHDGFTPAQWLKSVIRHRYSYAVYASDDRGPFWYDMSLLAMRLLRRLIKSGR